MIKYPSTNQFRNVIQAAKHHNVKQLEFLGTVKLHGTNAAIVVHRDGDVQFQSRERVLSLEEDNAGFMNANYGQRHTVALETLDYFQGADTVVIYGEWCGGNIQPGVGINGLPKMFVIFAYLVDNKWVDTAWAPNGYTNIKEYGTYHVMVDFDYPGLSQNTFIEITNAVEAECPVAAAYNTLGIGEGVVWKPIDQKYNSSDWWFKVKGEKHSVSKVKTLAAVDVEKVASIDAFGDMVCTEARLNQMLEGLTLEVKNIGVFIKRVHTDVCKEESDTIAANCLELKEVGKIVANKSKRWFMEKMNAQFN